MGWIINPRHGLLPPGDGGQSPADVPLRNNRVPNDPLPLARTVGAVLGIPRRDEHDTDTAHPSPATVASERMRRFARPSGKTVSNAFGGKRTVLPTPASPDFTLDDDDLRTAKAPRGQKVVDRQRGQNARALVGDVDENAPDGPGIFANRTAAATYITNSFDHGSLRERRQAYDFAQEILTTFAYDDRAEAPYLKAILTARALVAVSGGDLTSARDAFRALSGRSVNPDDDTLRQAFALQCELALDPNGFEALLDAAPGTVPAIEGLTKTEQRIHSDAHIETLRAAHRLLATWPHDRLKPRSLEELHIIVNGVLPEEERSNFLWFGSTVDKPVKEALHSEPFALRAFAAGVMLSRDPRATPPAALRTAYFAFRNNIGEEDLPKIQSRTFRIVEQAQLHTRNAKAESWLKELGSAFTSDFHDLHPDRKAKDTPFAAFEMGTAGVFLDHPDKDFGQAHAIDVVLTALNDVIVSEPPRMPGEMPDPNIVRAAVRAAVLRRWKEKITAKGWRDDMPFGRADRKKIMRDVAESLNLDPKFVLRHRRDFKVPPKVNAFSLDAWATEAGADRNQIIARSHRSHATVGNAPKTLGECLDRMKRMRNDGHRPPKNAQGNFDLLHEFVEHIPPTWGLRASLERSRGISTLPTANSGQNYGTDALPVSAALLPDLAYVDGRTSFIEIGSSAHTGQLIIGSAKRRNVSAGMGAYVGVSDGIVVASINGGVSAGSENVLETGVVFRARLEHLDDPTNNTAWRQTIQHLIKTISTSGQDGAMPETSEQMLMAIVDEFYKDPNLSVNWIERDASTKYATAGASAGLRIADPQGNKAGVFLSGSATAFRSSEAREDTTGNQTVSTNGRGQGRAVNASAAAVLSFEAIEAGLGPIASTSVPSLPMAAVSTTLFKKSTHSVLRGFYEDGRIVPEKTFLDTEFSRPKDFLAYVDNNNEEWREALGSQRELDKFTTKVKLSTVQGNRQWGERRQLTHEAADRINALMSVLRTYERSTLALGPKDARVVADIKRKLAVELENPANFRPLLLYAYENNSVAKTRGLNFLFVAAKTTSVSGEREIAFVRARHPHSTTTSADREDASVRPPQ